MKKIRIFATALLLAFTLSSCESFFDVELDDQAKIEDIFRQKTEVQKYLSHLYSYIPQEEEVVGMHGWTVGRSDEALFSWYQWVYYTQFRTGNYSSATTNFNYWPDYYIGINQCSIFLKYIDLDKEDTPTTVAYMKAEARFLRAWFYYNLLRQYGLPTDCAYPAEQMLGVVLHDKKSSGGSVSLIVPTAIGHCEIRKTPADEISNWLLAGGAQ